MPDYIQCGKCGCSMPFYPNMVYPVTWGGRPVCGNCRKELEGDLGKELKTDVCPECLESRPGDERVKAGMKCGLCSYNETPAFEHLLILSGATIKRVELSESDLTDGQAEAHYKPRKERLE